MKCNKSEECQVQNCEHKNEHKEVEYFENSCSTPCDVKGGIDGAICAKQ